MLPRSLFALLPFSLLHEVDEGIVRQYIVFPYYIKKKTVRSRARNFKLKIRTLKYAPIRFVRKIRQHREKGKKRRQTDHLNSPHHDLDMKCLTSYFIVSLLLILFFTSFFVRLSHPCYISPLKTPTEWKTAGSGTAQSTLCPILQWIPIYLSPLCPVRSPAPCPHLRWGCAAETKEKQPAWEHVSHPHMVHFLPLLLSVNLFPNPTPWWYSAVMAGSAFDKLKSTKI